MLPTGGIRERTVSPPFNFWNELPESARVIGSSGPLIDGQSVHALAYKEIGDPQQLTSLDKWFVVPRRYGGGFYDRLGNRWDDYTNLNHQAQLPQTLGADPAWLEVHVADDLTDAAEQIERLEIRLLLSDKADPQQVRVKLNGILLRDPAIENLWSIYRLTPQQLALGRNLVTLDDSSPQPRNKPLALEKVEVHVRCRKRSTGN